MPTATAIATPHVILPKNNPIATEIITRVAIVLPTLPCATFITWHRIFAMSLPPSLLVTIVLGDAGCGPSAIANGAEKILVANIVIGTVKLMEVRA
nr:hypothetical protein [Candidatus Bandiella woodruffii]